MVFSTHELQFFLWQGENFQRLKISKSKIKSFNLNIWTRPAPDCGIEPFLGLKFNNVSYLGMGCLVIQWNLTNLLSAKKESCGFCFFTLLFLLLLSVGHEERKLNLLPTLIKALLYVFGNLSANERRGGYYKGIRGYNKTFFNTRCYFWLFWRYFCMFSTRALFLAWKGWRGGETSRCKSRLSLNSSHFTFIFIAIFSLFRKLQISNLAKLIHFHFQLQYFKLYSLSCSLISETIWKTPLIFTFTFSFTFRTSSSLSVLLSSTMSTISSSTPPSVPVTQKPRKSCIQVRVLRPVDVFIIFYILDFTF